LLRGETNQGLRILRARAEAGTLRLLLEGRGGHTYTLGVRSGRDLLDTTGLQIKKTADADSQLLITFDGAPERYMRREINIPLQTPTAGRRKYAAHR
jgi:hypothetical protein